MARGFSSWILAFETQPDDPLSTLLSRAAYPESVISTEVAGPQSRGTGGAGG